METMIYSQLGWLQKADGNTSLHHLHARINADNMVKISIGFVTSLVTVYQSADLWFSYPDWKTDLAELQWSTNYPYVISSPIGPMNTAIAFTRIMDGHSSHTNESKYLKNKLSEQRTYFGKQQIALSSWEVSCSTSLTLLQTIRALGLFM